MRLRYSRRLDEDDEIREVVQNWEDSITLVVTAALLAAAGPEGFDADELDTVLVGASPAETTLLALGCLDRLWRQAWPDEL